MLKSEISVVIPTYNEEKYINRCLESLKQQSYKSFEIIVVDDGSTDNTLKIIQGSKSIEILEQNHQGPERARNKGAEAARGNILIFVDADMEFDKNYLDELTKPIRQGKAIGAVHGVEKVANFDNVWSKCMCIELGIYEQNGIYRQLDSSTVYRAILKNKFIDVGGFDDIGYTGDGTLFEKIKESPVICERAICGHNEPETLNEVYCALRWIGKSNMIDNSFRNMLKYSLINSFRHGIKRAIKYKMPSYIVFKCVHDFGILSGLFLSAFNKKTAYAK